jgi:hypothetical protein
VVELVSVVVALNGHKSSRLIGSQCLMDPVQELALHTYSRIELIQHYRIDSVELGTYFPSPKLNEACVGVEQIVFAEQTSDGGLHTCA